MTIRPGSQPVHPIFTAHLFPILEAHLLELLRSLEARDWELPTVAPAWNVKEVAAHLLDTQLRALARARGAAPPPTPAIRSNADLVALVNRLNHEGVSRYRNLEPSELIARMEASSRDVAAHRRSLDPFADSAIAVSWAGEERSSNWFDTAREFTERWHHQQQIRLAVDRPGIMTRELYHPVLDCFMRALPFAYRHRTGKPGTAARFNVSGDCGGSWYLQRDANRWRLVDAPAGEQVSETTIPQEIAWLVFTKGLSRASAAARGSCRSSGGKA